MNTELLAKYMDAKSKLDKYKKLENDLRMQLVAEVFPNAVEGTHNAFVDGLKIKGRFGFNFNINKKMFDELSVQMTDDELECVEFKPTLSISRFKKLADEDKPTLLEVLSITPAMPSIEIINEDVI